jgi:hypothetical protein
MTMVLRAILALGVDLVVCYLCGELILYYFFKRIRHVLTNVLVGFAFCQSLFEVITLVCYFLGEGLGEVTTCWLVVTGIMSVFGIIAQIRDKKQSDSRQKHGKWTVVIITVAVVGAFCYYVSVNGELNADSRYYISLVNTTVNTGTLFQYNPYNGVFGNAWYLRRALATYEIHSAMLCMVFRIPDLVVTRITRACESVILTSMVVYVLGSKVLWKDNPDKFDRSCYLVDLYLIFQLIFAGTYSSSASFFLFRAYEGKTLTANYLVLFTMYLCAEFVRNRELKYIFLLILALWSAAAVSSSAIMVIGAELMIFLTAYAIKEFVGWCRAKHVRC